MPGRTPLLPLLAMILTMALGGAAKADVLVVQLKLNGVVTGQAARCERPRAGDLAVSAGDLRRLGLALGPERGNDAAMVALSTLPGVDFDLDEAAQVLSLSVPPALLARRVISAADDGTAQGAQPWGALLDYAVSAIAGQASPDVSATLEARVFGPVGVFEASALVGEGQGAFVRGARRLDTAWIVDDPARLRRLVVGDFVTSTPVWADPVRAAGVSISTDFTTRPGFVFQPSPRVNGASGLPSVVDLYVDGVRRLSTRTDAGAFSLSQVPVVDGAGNVSLVVKDVLGRESVQSFSFYGSNQLLRPGLSAYAAQAGVLRRDAYGPDDAYTDAFVSGLLRRGVTDWLTLEVRGVASRPVREAGAGAVWKVAQAGVVSAAVNVTQGDGRLGAQVSASFRREAGPFSVFASILRALGRFDPLSGRAGDPVILRQVQAGGGWTDRRLGAVTLSYTAQRSRLSYDGIGDEGVGYVALPQAKVLALGWSHPLLDRMTVSASVLRDGGSVRQVTGALNLIVALGARRSAAAEVSGGQGQGVQAQAYASQAAPYEGGWGWRAQAQGPGPISDVQVGVQHVATSYGEQDAEVDLRRGGAAAVRLEASGAAVWLGGAPRLAAHIGEGFAVIETGAAGVDVSVENRNVGHTGRDGALLVPDLPAYAPARVEIDMTHLAMDEDATTPATVVRPRRMMGARVSMPVRASHAARVRLVRRDGRPVPLGAAVTLAGGDAGVVGYDGVAYLSGLAPRNAGRASGAGVDCAFSFAYAPAPGRAQVLGPVLCR